MVQTTGQRQTEPEQLVPDCTAIHARHEKEGERLQPLASGALNGDTPHFGTIRQLNLFHLNRSLGIPSKVHHSGRYLHCHGRHY